MKKFLLKSLLVTVGLLTGGSAWGETQTVYSWNFTNYGGGSAFYLPYNDSASPITVLEKNTYPCSTSKFSGLYIEATGEGDSKIRMDKSAGIRAYTSGGNVIAIPELKSGDVITVTCSTSGTKDVITGVTDNASLTVNSKTSFTITMTSAGNLGIKIRYYNEEASSWASVGSIVVTREVSCTDPTYTITGASGTSRKFTLGCATEGATIYYSETEKVAGADGWLEYTEEVTTSATTIWAYATKGGSNSDVISFATGAGTPIILDNPVISRTANTTVSISAPQSVLGTPVANIYYRIGESGDFTAYSEALTVSSHNTVYAYATASGYTNSSTASREVDFVANILPQTETLDRNNTFTSGGLDTSGDGIAGTSTTYYPVMIDGNQWGSNIYFQDVSDWGFRNAGKTWYNGSANSTKAWMLVKDLKKDDIVVIRIDERAKETVNATYVEKYSYNGHYAYSVTADGSIELRFMRKDDKDNNVLYGIDQYTTTVSATIGETGWTTFASPYALDLSNLTASAGDVTAYYASSVGDGKVTMTSTDQNGVAAGQGIMLKGTKDATITIPVVASGTAISGNKLVGCTTKTNLDANSNYYVLVSNDGKAEFQKLGTYGAEIPAGKAYLNAGSLGVRSLQIAFEEETTGINEVNAPEAAANGYFNLAGQRVANPTKGLYIVNGKKVLVK